MKKAPALFIGHGSPLNVIEQNIFNENLKILSKNLDASEIKAIICISAHYQSEGIEINGNAYPKTIHDFSGFPDILYKMEYKAAGSPELAIRLQNLLGKDAAKVTTNWGFDHGAWNVLWHLFPKANIPVVMLSLDYKLSFEEHFQIGSYLKELRNEGIMILGSGNIVHSFKGIYMSPEATPHPLALAFNEYAHEKINSDQNYEGLINFETRIEEAAKFSVNSAEHYLPLLYILGASTMEDVPSIFNNKIVFSTLSMLSVGFGLPSLSLGLLEPI